MEGYPEDYPGGMMEGYPDSEYFDGWGWEDDVVPVPGFGFFPSVMKEELEEEAEDFLREVRVSLFKEMSTLSRQAYKVSYKDTISVTNLFKMAASMTEILQYWRK